MADLPIIDRKIALELAGNDDAIVQQLLQMLAASLPEEFAAIEASYQQREWQHLCQQVHKLRSAASFCGAVALKTATTNLELILRNEEFDDLPKAYQTLDHEVKRLRNVLNTSL